MKNENNVLRNFIPKSRCKVLENVIINHEAIYMSVPKGQRTTSEIQFLYTARELQLHTIRKCVNFPKRYTFYVSQHLVACATRIHEYVKIGNSIYATNAHEAQLRIDYFIKAKAEVNNIVSQIEVACELFEIDDKAMIYWMELVKKENELLKGLLRSERAKLKNYSK